MITYTNEDCMELMARYPDKHFDLAIVDPPYGLGIESKNSIKECKSKKSASMSKCYGNQIWDNNVPDVNYFKELKRVSKHQIIWGVNYYPYELFLGGRIYWDKCVTMPTYSDGELAYCSLINSIKSIKIAWHGMIQHDMKNKEQRFHPTQKPVALYKWLLTNYAKQGDLILDTHVGSASSLIACYDMGFDAVGCELDKDYFEESKKRLEYFMKQPKLFEMEEQPKEQLDLFMGG
jgi:site-specific DNA-methyltransferase (adenine-specific)